VAELGAAFLMSHCGASNDIEQSASYLDGWSKALRNDPRLFPEAAAKAGQAVRYILNESQDTFNNENQEGS
jgi:antirestriction protein ArdC